MIFLSTLSLILYLVLPSRPVFLAVAAMGFSGAMPFVVIFQYRMIMPRKWFWIGTFVSFAILVASLEIGIRIGEHTGRFSPTGLGEGLRPDPLLFWADEEKRDGDGSGPKDTHEPLAFRSGPATLAKPEGVFRIVTMGGSTAWGYGIKNDEDTFSSRLETKLHSAFPDRKIEVIAAAVRGYTVFQNLVLYKIHIRNYDPDLVILYANANDESQVQSPYTYREYFKLKTGADISDLFLKNESFPKKKVNRTDLQAVFKKMHLYKFLVKNVADIRNDPNLAYLLKDANPVEDYERNLNDLIDIINKDGVTLLLADEFNYPNSRPNSKPNPRLERLRRAMTQTAEKRGVPFLPVHQILSAKEGNESLIRLPEDHIHLNPKGHEVLAELLFEKISEDLLPQDWKTPSGGDPLSPKP